jgi:hypothetical protein
MTEKVSDAALRDCAGTISTPCKPRSRNLNAGWLIGFILLAGCATSQKPACTASNSGELLDRTLELLEKDIGQIKNPTPEDRAWITEMTEMSINAWHAQVDGNTAEVCSHIRTIADKRHYDL